MKAPKQITIIGTHSEVKQSRTIVLDTPAKIKTFFDWQVARAAQGYILQQVSKVISEGKSEENDQKLKVLQPMMEDILSKIKAMQTSGIFESKYDFDYTWEEV